MQKPDETRLVSEQSRRLMLGPRISAYGAARPNLAEVQTILMGQDSDSFSLATTNSKSTVMAAFGTRGTTLAPRRTCFWFKRKRSDGLLVTILITPKDTWCISKESKAQLNTISTRNALPGSRCARLARACLRASNGASDAYGEIFFRDGSTFSEVWRRYQAVILSVCGQDESITSPTDSAWHRAARL